VLQGSDPAALASKWGQILQRPVEPSDACWHFEVDNATLRFVEAIDGRGEGLAAQAVALLGR